MVKIVRFVANSVIMGLGGSLGLIHATRPESGIIFMLKKDYVPFDTTPDGRGVYMTSEGISIRFVVFSKRGGLKLSIDTVEVDGVVKEDDGSGVVTLYDNIRENSPSGFGEFYVVGLGVGVKVVLFKKVDKRGIDYYKVQKDRKEVLNA